MRTGLISFTSSVTAGAVILSFLIYPFSSQALQSKTYTFNASSAFNYDTTGSVSFSGNNTIANWYNADWKYRQKITISKEFVGEELTDFPVVVRLDDLSLTGARDDRHDLLFTSSDGVTKLSHEREDNTTYWVKVPTLTPTEDTTLYLYYGNPSADDQQDASDVWANGYAGVWHLNNNPEGTTKDSTKNDNDGTSNGGMNENDSLRDGKIGKSLAFDGVDDYVEAGSVSEVNGATGLTLSVWTKFTGSTLGGMLSRYQSGDLTFNVERSTNPGGMFYGVVFDDAGRGVDRRGNPDRTVNDGKWHRVVFRWSGGNDASFYIDGQEDNGGQSTLQSPDRVRSSSLNVNIGRRQNGSVEFTGDIDEAHISNVARSASWIRAEYANQSNTEDFLTISSVVDTKTSESTVTLKSDRPLSFTSLKSFKPNTGGIVTYQLSNDAGKTWLFYTKDGWKSVNTSNTLHRSSANDIATHLNTFPRGLGKLTWKAYLTSGATLDTIAVGYIPGTSKTSISNKPTSLSDPRIVAINSLFNQVFNRYPTVDEWLFWANRMISGEKTSIDELYGAMQWQRLFGN